MPGTRGTECGSFQVMLRSVTIRSSGLLRAVGVCNILIVTDSSILIVQMIVCHHVVFSKSQALAQRNVERNVARNVAVSVVRNVGSRHCDIFQLRDAFLLCVRPS